jgi:hypothetical protein
MVKTPLLSKSVRGLAGRGSTVRDFRGLKLPSIYEGFRGLETGDLHDGHFVIDKIGSVD